MSVQLQGIEELRTLVYPDQWEPRPWYPRQRVYVAEHRRGLT